MGVAPQLRGRRLIPRPRAPPPRLWKWQDLTLPAPSWNSQIQPPRKTLEGRLRSAPSARRRRVLTGRHPGEASVLARVREPARPSGARGKRDFGRVQWSPGGGRTSGETKALGLPVFGFKHVGPLPNRSVSTSFTSVASPSALGPGLPRSL